MSATALKRAAGHATDVGVTVTWERHDLTASFPTGHFDLVSAQFLHSPWRRRASASPSFARRPARSPPAADS
ncbi:hypothetical protein GCM10029964_032390 [Kibdelosporangium lantanae]